MAHKKINASHSCAFLRFRFFIDFVVTAKTTMWLMSQASITPLICTHSSFAMMVRWKKKKFGGGYIGMKDQVNRRKYILESDVRSIGCIDFDRPWEVGGCDGGVRERRNKGWRRDSIDSRWLLWVVLAMSVKGFPQLLSRSTKEYIGSRTRKTVTIWFRRVRTPGAPRACRRRTW